MLRLPRRSTELIAEQERDLFMVRLEDDTEEAPWMTMGDLQFWSASSFAHSLRNYAHEQGLPWYVASMMPIRYRWGKRIRQLAPDNFVAFVPEHARTSFRVEHEGGFPPFVLEVVSPSSVDRDRRIKRIAYERLQVREYAIFTPRDSEPSELSGFRMNPDDHFEPWELDDLGRLWSEVLGLYLVVRGNLVQAQTRDGRLLLTPDQAAEAYRAETEALRAVEAENDRLRREIERLRREGP